MAKNNNWNDLIENKQNFIYTKYGLSLLRQLPMQRSCETTGISEEFCLCEREDTLNTTNNHLIKLAANELIKHINKLLLKEVNKCAKLTLKEIKNAQIILPNPKLVYLLIFFNTHLN